MSYIDKDFVTSSFSKWTNMNPTSQMRSRINCGQYSNANVSQFKKDLFNVFELDGIEKREKVYSLAWSMSRQQFPADLLSVLVAFEQLLTLVRD